MINELTINSIFKQIVIDMAYDPDLQVNTFALISQAPNLRQPAFGLTYQDYLDGNYWSRTWYNEGQNPESIKAEYPVLFVEPQHIELECIDGQEETFEYDLLLIDKIDCPGCPPGHDRTKSRVQQNTKLMIRFILNELNTYQLWEVDRDGLTTFEWISEGRLGHYQALPDVDPIAMHDELLVYLEQEDIQIKPWGNNPDFRAWFVTIRFTFCELLKPNFDYDNPVIPSIASTRCDSC